MTDVSADPGISGRLVSGEAVELDVRVARLGSRVLAFGIDLVCLAVLVVLLLLPIALLLGILEAIGLVDQALLAATITLSSVVIFVGVPVSIETLSKGRSIGKAIVGLRVVRDDGGPIRLRHALVRSVTAFAVEFPGLLMPGLTWLATIAVMLVHPSGKRIGDLSAGTIVIHERMPVARQWRPVMPPGLAQWAATTDLTGLGDDLALSIRHFLARNRDIREPARTRLGAALAAELSQHVTPPPPPGTPGWAVLAAVLAERYRRNAGRLRTHRKVTAQVWDTLYRPQFPPYPPPHPGPPPPGHQPYAAPPRAPASL